MKWCGSRPWWLGLGCLLTACSRAPAAGPDEAVIVAVEAGPASPETAFEPLAPDPVDRTAYRFIEVTPSELVLRQPIEFDAVVVELRPESDAVLDDIAAALGDHPEISLEIQCHTDTRGDSDYNLALSVKRAEAVKSALVARGVAAARLRPAGYGAQKPISDDWQKNRRIVLVRTDGR